MRTYAGPAGQNAAVPRAAVPRVAVPRVADPHPPAGDRRRRVWAWARVLGGLGILAVLLWRLGTSGFTDGLRLVDARILLTASGIGLLTTVLNAWRWQLVARGLGVSLSLPTATADYYRALFLNASLPGGILGDVHRAVRHGRDVGDLGLGVRAVILERFAGQLVLVAVGVTVLLAFPPPVLSPGRLVTISPAGMVGLAAGGLAVAVAVAVVIRSRWGGARWGRGFRTAGSAVRRGLLARTIWPGIVVSSTLALAGYLATFLVAARAAGVTAPVAQLLPLMVLALLAMALPINIGGWGPREGVCAWAFAAAGLGATQGLTVAVVYGLSVFVASLPGAGVLVIRWITRWRGGQAVANRSESA